jgi:hypothetical protein
LIASIALQAAFEFGLPVFRIGFRSRSALAAGVPVPEASLYEDRRCVFRKNDIRLAGQFPIVRLIDRKAITKSMQQAASYPFGFNILARHPLMSQG